MIASPPSSTTDPHFGQRVYQTGEPLESARSAMVLIHGRGASAQDILSLAAELVMPGWIYLAPQAAAYSWYPEPFLAPTERNEPWLTSALNFISRVGQEIEAAGIPKNRTMILGFSQGACLALEWAARHPVRYGGIVGLTGSLIGPTNSPRSYSGSFEGTPVFLGCSDVDFHIPQERVQYSAEMMRALGAEVTLRLYPGMGHTVNLDELDFVRGMMTEMDHSMGRG